MKLTLRSTSKEKSRTNEIEESSESVLIILTEHTSPTLAVLPTSTANDMFEISSTANVVSAASNETVQGPLSTDNVCAYVDSVVPRFVIETSV